MPSDKPIEKIKLRPWIKRYVTNRKVGSRFTNRGLSREIANILHIDTTDARPYLMRDGKREFLITIPMVNTLLNDCNHALNGIRDKNGARVWYHDTKRIPTWFHRDHCNLNEAMKFYHYLKEKVKAADNEAEQVLDYIKQRCRAGKRRAA